MVRLQPILDISFGYISLAPGQWFNCPSASEATLINMGEIIQVNLLRAVI